MQSFLISSTPRPTPPPMTVQAAAAEPAFECPPNKIPHFIIIGTQKSGTTAINAILRHHPHLEGLEREAHFFDKRATEHWGKKQLDAETLCSLRKAYAKKWKGQNGMTTYEKIDPPSTCFFQTLLP
jgi:hypothetical protein